MNTQKNCRNCTYYKAHYAIDEHGFYYDVNTGHCSNAHIGISGFRRCIKYNDACPHWQQAAENQIEPEGTIYGEIRKTAKRVEQLAAFVNFKFEDQ